MPFRASNFQDSRDNKHNDEDISCILNPMDKQSYIGVFKDSIHTLVKEFDDQSYGTVGNTIFVGNSKAGREDSNAYRGRTSPEKTKTHLWHTNAVRDMKKIW